MPLSYFSREFSPSSGVHPAGCSLRFLPLNNDSLRRCLDGILSCEPGEKGKSQVTRP